MRDEIAESLGALCSRCVAGGAEGLLLAARQIQSCAKSTWRSCATARVGLLRGGFFAEAAHALLKLFAERRRSVGIESNEIPERLRSIAAEAGERGRVAIGMARDVFPDGRIRMVR